MATEETDKLDRLLQGTAAGNAADFRCFYDLTAPAVLATLLRLTRDRHHAEDLLQDTMVTAWNRADDFDASIASARTWIMTIARRKALDVLRGQRRRSEILQDDAADIRATLGLQQDTAALAPESTMTDERLQDCLDKLQPDAAACIRSAYLDGLTFVEISAVFERSLGTVKSWVRRGLQSLKTCMQQ